MPGRRVEAWYRVVSDMVDSWRRGGRGKGRGAEEDGRDQRPVAIGGEPTEAALAGCVVELELELGPMQVGRRANLPRVHDMPPKDPQ